MAIELQVSSVTALVIGESRERNLYDSQGPDRKIRGRVVDGEGRPVSGFNAVVHCQPLGLLGDAQVQLPDIQVKGLEVGAVVRIEGTVSARLLGGDYSAIRATITGERIAPLGRWTDWIVAQTGGKPADKAA